jgi:mannose-1-phosphate guanylyltransferase
LVYGVILAGGRGERFWPLSRSRRAKQFLPLAGDTTLLAMTAARLAPLVPLSRLLVITGHDQGDLVRESIPGLPDEHIIREPIGRNTAPAVALGVSWARHLDDDAVVIVVPSDAWVGDAELYREALGRAVTAAELSNVLVTIGIAPSRPETGYGYLETGDPLPHDPEVLHVRRFVEKPDLARAMEYLAGGRHLWNCGIFVMRARVFEAALVAHLPELAAAAGGIRTGGYASTETLASYYAAAPSISVDYGVMERADNVVTVRARFPWDDLGSWAALERILPAEDDHVGRGDTLALESPGSILYSEEGIVAVLGAPGLIVVRTKDCTLVLPAERAQEVRRIVQALSQRDDLRHYL